MSNPKFYSYCILALFTLLPLNAAAYVGPGLGAGTIGVVVGLVGSILLALFAFFWYPIKRALFGKKIDKEDEEEEAVDAMPAAEASSNSKEP
jgi:hypothetical protein